MDIITKYSLDSNSHEITPEGTDFKKFIKHYPIVFVLGTMKIDSLQLASFIANNLGIKDFHTQLPDDNNDDYIIISPNNVLIFDEIIHTRLTKRPYKKFPKGIVIVLSFDNLVDMEAPFIEIKILTEYKIPILYCTICDENTNYKTKLLDVKYYNESLILNDSESQIHIKNPDEFKSMMKEKLANKVNISNKIEIYCYFNQINKDRWLHFLKIFESIEYFYFRVTNSNCKILDFEDDQLIVY
uniref:Uncharacterized protein n=1 Tax=viral metagenome TaxID=1070528 RepID=A0A6C0BDD5_9ZZZZ